MSAIDEAYSRVYATARGDTGPEPEPAMTHERFEALMDDLSRRMCEAAREMRGPSFGLKGVTVTGEWPEAKDNT